MIYIDGGLSFVCCPAPSTVKNFSYTRPSDGTVTFLQQQQAATLCSFERVTPEWEEGLLSYFRFHFDGIRKHLIKGSLR